MQPASNASDETRQFCTFSITGRLFGLPVTDVKEIHPVVKFTPVHHASEEVKGFVNIRGQVHLIIDLRILLGFETKESDELSQIVLFKPHAGDSFGILVDAIGDVIKTDRNHMEGIKKTDQKNADSYIRRFSNLVKGICRLENELLIILDSTALLRQIEKK